MDYTMDSEIEEDLEAGGLSDSADDRHPLLSEYYMRTDKRLTQADTISLLSHVEWTNCDELKRCCAAVTTFLTVASVSGAMLIAFWFCWAAFVLWLGLPGILTPILWLCGFTAPLCLFRLFTDAVRCLKSSSRSLWFCCRGESDELRSPKCNSWRAYHLWSERKKHVRLVDSCIRRQLSDALEQTKQAMMNEESIVLVSERDGESSTNQSQNHSKSNHEGEVSMLSDLPWQMHLSEMISEYCFHNDMVVTCQGKKIVGLYPDSAELHTLVEFDQPITECVIPNGDITRAYLLITKARESALSAGNNANRNNNNQAGGAAGRGGPRGGCCGCDDIGFIDCMVAEYDLAKGQMLCESELITFEYVKCGYVAELKGIEYKPTVRLMSNSDGSRLILSLDGDFVVFDTHLLSNDNLAISNDEPSQRRARLTQVMRRQVVFSPADAADREQIMHIREYRWHSAVSVPKKICESIIKIVDTVENTNAQEYMLDRVKDEEFVMVPFGEHALFVANIWTGWLRYLDFGGVDAVRESEINHVAFSRDCQSHIYLCLSDTLALISVHNFQPLLVVDYAESVDGYERMVHSALGTAGMAGGGGLTIPCGMVTLPPEGVQVSAMRNYYAQRRSLGLQSRREDDEILSDDQLADKLESLAIFFTTSRLLVDPRCFMYRFPRNKSRTLTMAPKHRFNNNNVRKSNKKDGLRRRSKKDDDMDDDDIEDWDALAAPAKGFSVSKRSNRLKKRDRKKRIVDSKWLLNRYADGRMLLADQSNVDRNGRGDSEDSSCVLQSVGGGWQYLSLAARPWRFRTDNMRIEPVVKREAVSSVSGSDIEDGCVTANSKASMKKHKNNSKSQWMKAKKQGVNNKQQTGLVSMQSGEPGKVNANNSGVSRRRGWFGFASSWFGRSKVTTSVPTNTNEAEPMTGALVTSEPGLGGGYGAGSGSLLGRGSEESQTDNEDGVDTATIVTEGAGYQNCSSHSLVGHEESVVTNDFVIPMLGRI